MSLCQISDHSHEKLYMYIHDFDARTFYKKNNKINKNNFQDFEDFEDVHLSKMLKKIKIKPLFFLDLHIANL